MNNKFFAVILSLVVLASCFAVPAFAAAGETSVAVNYTTAMVTGYTANADGSIYDIPKSHFTMTSSSSTGWSYNIGFDSFVDSAVDTETGRTSSGWIGFCFKVRPTTDLSSYDLSKYDLTLTWSSYATSVSEDIYASDLQDFLDSNGHMGLSADNSALYVPRFGSVNAWSLASINHDTLGKLLQTVTFTNSETVSALTNASGYNVYLPLYAYGDNTVSIRFALTLTPKTVQTGDYDLGVPDSYTFGIPMTYGLGAQGLDQSITDVYSIYNASGLHNGYRFRDYSNYYNIASFPFLRDYFGAFITVGRKDNLSDASAWQNSVLDTIKFNVPYSVTIPDGFDLNAQKTEFLFRIRIAGNEHQLNWFDLSSLADSLRSRFYDFEPYALKVGEFTIGYKYFTTQYYSAQNTVELTLRLSSADEAQKMFIKALLENTSFSLTFSVAPDMHGAIVGLPYAGFFLGDASPSPDSPPAGGFSQSDIDAAFNRGYSSGLSDGSDKNYVYGFVNGTWTAFNDFYKTVTNGISIGGIRLSAIITSICIVAILVVVIKKVV